MKLQFRALVAMGAALSLATPGAFAGDKKKKDPEEIGNRDVGKGVNFYSLEKEIALGKQLAQEVERQAKIIDDPVIAEYVNRVGQNLVRNSDAKVPSLTAVYPGTDFPERETYDMFGIEFDGHPDLRRIFMEESFPGHPLRKSFLPPRSDARGG